MKISTYGRFALRMMVDIAEHDGPVTLKDIAARQGLSKKYLEQIALRLSQAGYFTTSRGHHGGFSLAKPADQITVLEVLQTVESSMAVVECLETMPNECPRCADCKTLPLWTGLKTVIEEYLGSITLQDLVDGKVPQQ